MDYAAIAHVKLRLPITRDRHGSAYLQISRAFHVITRPTGPVLAALVPDGGGGCGDSLRVKSVVVELFPVVAQLGGLADALVVNV